MDAYENIKAFLTKEMRRSHIYQPVMIKELLEKGGSSQAKDIAQAILSHDATQIEYYTQVVRNTAGRVLTRNKGITTRDGDVYHLIGAGDLSNEQRAELIAICDQSVQANLVVGARRQVHRADPAAICAQRVEANLEARGEAGWSHRRRGHRPISGS